MKYIRFYRDLQRVGGNDYGSRAKRLGCREETSRYRIRNETTRGKRLGANWSPDEICDGWATHFGSLATLLENENFDDVLKTKCTEDINHIHNICLNTAEEIIPA